MFFVLFMLGVVWCVFAGLSYMGCGAVRVDVPSCLGTPSMRRGKKGAAGKKLHVGEDQKKKRELRQGDEGEEGEISSTLEAKRVTSRRERGRRAFRELKRGLLHVSQLRQSDPPHTSRKGKAPTGCIPRLYRVPLLQKAGASDAQKGMRRSTAPREGALQPQAGCKHSRVCGGKKENAVRHSSFRVDLKL